MRKEKEDECMNELKEYFNILDNWAISLIPLVISKDSLLLVVRASFYCFEEVFSTQFQPIQWK